MQQSAPVIGLTLSAVSATAGAEYIGALEAHGAQVVRLAPGAAPVPTAELDGVLLSGGVDVDPCWYGELAAPGLGAVDAARDHLEVPLARESLARQLPLLGICRGAQVLGVALGGTLHQDLPSCLPGGLAHDGGAEHPVRIAPDSRLRAVLGADQIVTNSYHHQANARPGPQAAAAAWSQDGVIEAIEAGPGFCLGVQWHPERMLPAAEQARLFAAFVAAAREVRDRRPLL